ncbi:hypothetical protein BN135_392 [Cronobacter muytjensii 530]
MQVIQPFRCGDALKISDACRVFIPGVDLKPARGEIKAVAPVAAAEIQRAARLDVIHGVQYVGVRGRQAIFFSEVIFIANVHGSSSEMSPADNNPCGLSARRQRYILNAFYKTSALNAIAFPAR